MIPNVGDVYCVYGHEAGMRTFAVYYLSSPHCLQVLMTISSSERQAIAL